MKKGLRRFGDAMVSGPFHSNSRPDEEGIKTPLTVSPPRNGAIPTADLMKKGLRRQTLYLVSSVGAIPTADLMKKGLRHVLQDLFRVGACIPTADLMKKGLRLLTVSIIKVCSDSNSRPDEEGIKTDTAINISSRGFIPTADLMKKGLRRLSPVWPSCLEGIPTADLMKKGLRQDVFHRLFTGGFQQQT